MNISVTETNLTEFLARKPYSVIHFDAGWDGYRQIMVDSINSLKPEMIEEISFGYSDCESEPNLAGAAGIVNVPALAYYRGSSLVATVIGLKQDIAGNIQRLQRGEVLDTSNRLSRG